MKPTTILLLGAAGVGAFLLLRSTSSATAGLDTPPKPVGGGGFAGLLKGIVTLGTTALEKKLGCVGAGCLE